MTDQGQNENEGQAPLGTVRTLIRPIETLGPRASCAEAARLMRDKNIGSVVVADDSEPLGIVTDRDLALRVVAEAQDAQSIRLEDIMSPQPAFVSLRRTLDDALKIMRDLGVRRLPVVNTNGRLEGIVSMDDIFTHLARQIGQMGEAVERELELGRF
jgi:CBS domain-containing protein